MRRDMLVPVLVAILMAGCVEQPGYGPPPANAAPPPPAATPPPPQAAPSQAAPSGSFLTENDYDRGVEEGRRAGTHAPVAGYFVGGALIGGILAPLCVIAILGAGKGGGGGHGGGGDCGGGSCDFGSPNVVVAASPQPQWLPADYQSGFTTGYQQTFKPRKTHAMVGGFIFGFVLAATATVIYFSNPANDSGTRSSASTMTAAHAPPPQGLAVHF